MKKLLIITGPQGSGNHLFSKIFSSHPAVYGWKDLLDTYWLGHHTEPFAKYWGNAAELSKFDWNQSDYYVTSISVPFVQNKEMHMPNFKEFIKFARCHVDSIQLAIIGRDQNILKVQQERVRDAHTTPLALEAYQQIFDVGTPYFLSQELLYLYKSEYLQRIALDLDWPVDYKNDKVLDLCNKDANEKYIYPIKEHWLDAEVTAAVKES